MGKSRVGGGGFVTRESSCELGTALKMNWLEA